MTNEMIRPCIIKDISESPFDACIAEVFKDSEDLEAYILLREEKNRMCLFKHYVKCNSIEELDSMYNSWVCSLADALNGPVLATEEVLAGLPKDAKVWVVTDEGDRKTYDKATYKYMRYDTDPIWVYTPYDCSVCEDDGYEYPREVYTRSGCYLVADKDDPKTTQYLRQFTLQGVRRLGNA
jgi:hypothetical protein